MGSSVREPPRGAFAQSSAWYVDDPTGYTIEVACWDDDRVRFDPSPRG